jgi:hypothetical protein
VSEVHHFLLSVGLRNWVSTLCRGGIYRSAIDQICRRYVFHCQPKRLEQGNLFRRFPAGLRPDHDLSNLGEGFPGGDDVTGFSEGGFV